MSEVNGNLARAVAAQHRLESAINRYCAASADRARNPFVPHPEIDAAQRDAHAALAQLMQARSDAVQDMLRPKAERKVG